MFGFLKSLFGDTRPATKAKANTRPGAVKPGANPPPRPRVKAAPGVPAMTDERARLLKQAQDVHRAKRKILDHLSDEDRAKLVSMAILTFLNDSKK